MPTFSYNNVMGDTIDYNEISSDVIKWNKLETLTYSGDATKNTTATITGYDFLRVTGLLLPSGTDTVNIQVNGSTANIWDMVMTADNSISLSSAVAYATIGKGNSTTAIMVDIRLQAVSAAIASGECVWKCASSCAADAGSNVSIFGTVQLGNAAAITEVLIKAQGAQTFTGTITVWGGNWT